MKGVRTRYRNSLEKEVSLCMDILSQDIKDTNKEEEITKASKCIKMLRLNCKKEQLQSEKYVSALQDGIPEEIEKSLDEDCTICKKAMECCVLLEEHIERIRQRFEREEKTDIKQVYKKVQYNNKCKRS